MPEKADTPTRGPYSKGVARRQQILREALAVYAESDGSGTSLRTIAARVGLSERGLLHYFASRDDLLVSVLIERDRADRTLFDPEAPIEELTAVQARSSETPGLVRLFLEMAAASPNPEHAAHHFFSTRYRQLRGMLEHMFRRSAEVAGSTVPPDEEAEWAARVLIAASDGLQVQWLLDPTIDMEADLERLALVLRGISAPSNESDTP